MSGKDLPHRGYSRQDWQGLRVERAPIWLARRPGGIARIASMASFAVSSLPLLARQVAWRPDIVWTVAPALACAPGAWALARLVGAAAWLHIQDFEVDAAFELGILRGARARRVAAAIERWLFARFDCVSAISPAMVERLGQKGVRASRTRLFPNWVDVGDIRPLGRPSQYRQELGIPADAVVALYSGSMGSKQGLEVIAAAARMLGDLPTLHFVLCGAGPGRDALVAAAAGLPRIHWLPLQPVERLSELLGVADLHLLPQRAGAADLVMPSKLTGMLASGRAVVATAPEQTTVGRIVARCGAVVAPEDAEALAGAVRALALEPARRERLGAEARRLAEAELSRDAILGRFARELTDLVPVASTLPAS
jgi:colanic acid biosynthesis glycosyl transferase WcaI